MQKFIRYGLGAAFFCYAYLSLFYVSYWAHSNKLIIAALAAALVAVSLSLPLWLRRYDFTVEIDAGAAARLFWIIVGAGIVIRCIWVTLYPPVQQSDFLDYWNAATRLIDEGLYYYIVEGNKLLAWRPPGYPILLAGLMAVFGPVFWLPFAINIACLVVSCVAVRTLTDMLVGNRTAGLFGAALIAAWPSYIIGSGYPASEWLSLALLTVSFWAILKAQGGGWRFAILAGLCMGYGILVRPGLIFLPCCWFIYFALGRHVDRRLVAVNLVAVAVAVAVVAPWSVRNYQVLDAFVPVSTNGGDVFYRANNPLANGTYLDRGERDLAALMGDEATWNRTGMAWGLEWIRDNPLDFLKLAVRKQIYYTGQDTTMVYWALDRAYGETGPFYVALRLLTNWYWTAVLVLIAVAVFASRRWMFANPVAGLLDMTILYPVVIHSVFESQSRHHLPSIGLMAVLAATALWRPVTDAMTQDHQ